jgi:cell division protein FtsW
VSYGGTSMVANGIMVGVLLNISRQSKTRTPDEMRRDHENFV